MEPPTINAQPSIPPPPPPTALPYAQPPSQIYQPPGAPPAQPIQPAQHVPADLLAAAHAAPTDRLAVLSAICGMSAMIPVVSQVAGLVMGILSLRNIKRAANAGLVIDGKGWAWLGISSSAFTLLGWMAFMAALSMIGNSLMDSAGALEQLPGALDQLQGF
ncbi:MAG: hypothetical protein ACYTHJ_17630 [Planctomycetota bacterium]|jgi:hypothetical protein